MSPAAAPDPERERLRDPGPWRRWGPYLSERAWGTVREDYSADGDAWSYFPFDQARSRAYRWNEDGLGGVCDADQRFCFAFAFWNGADPFLKERAFGLTNAQGNHGEDVKEHYWFLDSTPSHAFMRWRYHYPQTAFPYDQLVAENARRTRTDPEFELLDTGAFDSGYWAITVDYAKAAPTDLCIRVTVTNHGAAPAVLHVLPTLWFRNRWAWGDGIPEPVIRSDGTQLVAEEAELGRLVLAGDGAPDPLLCDNETNNELLFGVPGRSQYPKDGINDYVVHGRATHNPLGVGTKGALHYQLRVEPAASATIRLRLAQADRPPTLRADWTRVLALREREADAFYAALAPAASPEEALVLRQAAAGLLWSKQFYHYDVARWLAGDEGQPPPAPARADGRNRRWTHLFNHEIVSMPDTWEYPWYAAWDLAFHCVALAHLDPAFAKAQLVLLCREWYMHPNGQLPAYEWDFDDVNPPLHAWAALRVFQIDGGQDYDFLERVFHKLLINFTWWVNREDSEGNNLFEGGFLGLDNVGPFDRSHLPVAGTLEQSDATAWMARYCLDLLAIALVLARHDRTYADVATKFLEHFAYISAAVRRQGLWDEQDGFFYDVLRWPDGSRVPVRVRSVVGLIPIAAVLALDEETLQLLPGFRDRLAWFEANKPELCGAMLFGPRDASAPLLSVVDPAQLQRLVPRLRDEGEFLSAHGWRSLSAYHREHPAVVELGGLATSVDYEPGESQSGLFGGNSNWRGPVWFPLNYLLVHALQEFAPHLPGQGLAELAADVRDRLVALFTPDAAGRRPVFGDRLRLQTDPDWRDLLTFNEYFHGDTGAGLGASHQTGWTGLVLPLILEALAAR